MRACTYLLLLLLGSCSGVTQWTIPTRPVVAPITGPTTYKFRPTNAGPGSPASLKAENLRREVRLRSRSQTVRVVR